MAGDESLTRMATCEHVVDEVTLGARRGRLDALNRDGSQRTQAVVTMRSACFAACNSSGSLMKQRVFGGVTAERGAVGFNVWRFFAVAVAARPELAAQGWTSATSVGRRR